jgi:hypothetical protein
LEWEVGAAERDQTKNEVDFYPCALAAWSFERSPTGLFRCVAMS